MLLNTIPAFICAKSSRCNLESGCFGLSENLISIPFGRKQMFNTGHFCRWASSMRNVDIFNIGRYLADYCSCNENIKTKFRTKFHGLKVVLYTLYARCNGLSVELYTLYARCNNLPLALYTLYARCNNLPMECHIEEPPYI